LGPVIVLNPAQKTKNIILNPITNHLIWQKLLKKIPYQKQKQKPYNIMVRKLANP